MRQGYVIEIAVPSGDPEGIQEITKSDWPGQAFVFGRVDLEEAGRIQNINTPGVYLLLGEDSTDTFGQQIYIGESDEVGKRLKEQNRDPKREFWVRTMVFVSRLGNINKAHTRYVEAKLIEMAKSAGQATVDNDTDPTPQGNHQSVRIVAEGFLTELLSICRMLGIKAFGIPDSVSKARKRYYLGRDRFAKGEEHSDNFLVLAGSKIKPISQAGIPDSSARVRDHLINVGILVEVDDVLTFDSDYMFSSPTAAAEVCLGYHVSGRESWKDPQGVTLAAQG